MRGMSTAVTNLPSDYLQSLLNSSLQNAGSTANNTIDNLASTAAALGLEQSDNGGLSPFAQLMSTLQQLEQSNPTESTRRLPSKSPRILQLPAKLPSRRGIRPRRTSSTS